jgi:hypothetical protein
MADDHRDDADFIANKRSDRIYVSRPFKIGVEKNKDARYISRVFDEAERSRFDVVDDEIVLRATHNDKVQIKAVITSDDHQIRQLTLQSFRIYKDGARPNEEYGINLRGTEIRRLIEFIEVATKLEVTTRGKLRIDREALAHIDMEMDEAARAWLAKNPEALREIVAGETTSQDVVAVAYRKTQLKTFERLLNEPDYFDAIAKDKFDGRDEAVWQAFFEKNRWIFGYGLFYLSASGFAGEKFEQVIAGATVATAGKRIDGLLRTRGRISAVCLVEIKRHRTQLMESGEYRAGVWRPSKELTGAVAQVLMSVDGMERQFQRKLMKNDSAGNPTGEDAFIARPRSVVVCGCLSEFISEHGVNEERFRNFELYRRHLVAPDVITFDELFERAKLVVDSAQTN